MLENRETVTAKDVFLTIANIWQLRRLDHICPSVHPRRDVRVSNVSITGWSCSPPQRYLVRQGFRPLGWEEKIRCGVRCKDSGFSGIGIQPRFSWIFQNGV